MSTAQETASKVCRGPPMHYWRDKVKPKYSLLVKHINPEQILPFLGKSLSATDQEEIVIQQHNSGPRYAAEVLLYNLASRPQPQGFRDLMSALIEPDVGLVNIALSLDSNFAEFLANEKGINLADYIEEDSDDEYYLQTLKAGANRSLSPNLAPAEQQLVASAMDSLADRYPDKDKLGSSENECESQSDSGGSTNGSDDSETDASDDDLSTVAPTVEYNFVDSEVGSTSDVSEVENHLLSQNQGDYSNGQDIQPESNTILSNGDVDNYEEIKDTPSAGKHFNSSCTLVEELCSENPNLQNGDHYNIPELVISGIDHTGEPLQLPNKVLESKEIKDAEYPDRAPIEEDNIPSTVHNVHSAHVEAIRFPKVLKSEVDAKSIGWNTFYTYGVPLTAVVFVGAIVFLYIRRKH